MECARSIPGSAYCTRSHKRLYVVVSNQGSKTTYFPTLECGKAPSDEASGEQESASSSGIDAQSANEESME